ncbi:hypothetical protein FPF71_00720 [Algibacter amylolyticus]|uniref:Uncharacterized protein n=1 Tax=Algibacter amylolyticus TaxID=1608400 RepID=A0A5M7BIP4_9FLAO|nr:DUF5687 family protein [Algibacter amylolyticus]KAA5827401.1 hypothetical protein F2B50_00720 [Algibacter amylolyticus]MBB5266592.1 hypothetical protein [Algibacter amylolyticus]TSJ81646.1 hypothetical protein FPF71_00720 [Algibacter amylolyticus]
MIKRFLSLEWKSFFRSASFGKSLGIKIFMGFLSLYLIAMFLILGIGLFPALQEFFPESDPLLIVNSFLFYWILGDLVIRFFFQKLPVMSVMPLLVLPIKRSKIVNYVLGKSVFSFFNALPLFAIIPFGVTLIVKDYPVSQVIGWMAALIVVVLIINFLNFIVESFSAEKELSFLPILVLAGGLYGLNHFNVVSFSEIIGNGFNAIYNQSVFIVVPILILLACYVLNFKLLKQKLFLDSGLKTKIKEVNTSNLDWTKNFGDIAPFLQLDLKLIWRNKRTKSTVWMVVFGLLYGLVFYVNPQFISMTPSYIFVGVFSTGIFLMNFGQFVPAWDSSYYGLLMTQNLKYEQYLKSKFTLMALSVLILFVLGIPYVYFGWKVLFAHFAAAIYNMGVNTHVILLGGSFNRKKINLNEKAVFNYQGTGAVQWLIGIPILLLPMGIFAVVYFLTGFEIACLVLIILGIVGIVFHQKIMKLITKKYTDSKYKMIDAFNQDN